MIPQLAWLSIWSLQTCMVPRTLFEQIRAQHVCGKSHCLLLCHRCLRAAAGHAARLTPFCTPPSSTRCGRLASCGRSSTLHPFSSKFCCLTHPEVYQSEEHVVSPGAGPLVAAAASPPDSVTRLLLQQRLHPSCQASLHSWYQQGPGSAVQHAGAWHLTQGHLHSREWFYGVHNNLFAFTLLDKFVTWVPSTQVLNMLSPPAAGRHTARGCCGAASCRRWRGSS